MVGQEKGILKVFLSFPAGDSTDTNEKLLHQLCSAFESAAIEYFISRSDGSQKKALKELHTSDIAVFLISPFRDVDMSFCEFKKECKVDCGMKTGKESISYTWCEFRTALSENKPYLIYIMDEKNAGKDWITWEMGNECEREYCSRIQHEEGIERVTNHFVNSVFAWYSDGKINLHRFCGRRDLLKELFNKMNKSIEVYGVGGIGKTTLCEAVLLMWRVLGRKVFYMGEKEGYASGTGYELGLHHVVRHRFSDVTLDDILDVLGFKEALRKADEKRKIDAILNFLDKEDAILYIDNFKENESLKELVKGGNNLERGCILISLKKELGAAFYRLPVERIEKDERGTLVEIMASRMGRTIKTREKGRIADVGGGHPVATYLLVSNFGRGNIAELESFRKGLDFSRDDDVKEYMDRVVRSSIRPETYIFLKDLAVIEEEIDVESIFKAFSSVYSYCESIFMELLDTFILERKKNKFVWRYNQIREAVFKDNPRKHNLAAMYYKEKLERYTNIEDEIEMLYHVARIEYKGEILERFLALSDVIGLRDPALKLLPKLGQEI